ncbi:hypothetical protein [Gracilimonas sp.]|uniref:hypothetical protein n=1 Tax=Gracilimonas sp. TaxID=1974203 RepID=UPI0032EAD0FC
MSELILSLVKHVLSSIFMGFILWYHLERGVVFMPFVGWVTKDEKPVYFQLTINFGYAVLFVLLVSSVLTVTHFMDITEVGGFFDTGFNE